MTQSTNNANPTAWPIGCFNRPWTQWSFAEALQALKAAGYQTTGLLSRTKSDPFIGVEATPAYLATLQQQLTASGLSANMGALRSRHNIPLDESIKEVCQQIDNAHFLSLTYVMSFGVDEPAEFAHYRQVMHVAAAYAADKSIRLVMKPHGGISGTAAEILQTIRDVNHPNFTIWYDAGNIIYYTGKDPVAEIDPIAPYITGFCAKDCAAPKSDVMIQFGAGKVDFRAVFQRLKVHGFAGPVMVECCQVGPTPAATMVNARANREFLERVLATL